MTLELSDRALTPTTREAFVDRVIDTLGPGRTSWRPETRRSPSRPLRAPARRSAAGQPVLATVRAALDAIGYDVEAAVLAGEFVRRGVGLVIVDSKIFALAAGEGDHEPMTNLYTALRLFAPAASLVLNHVTGADARGEGPTRPSGVFAYGGPRLIWETKRDRAVSNATAFVFSCAAVLAGLAGLDGPPRT